jgi:hypothetical protein
MVAHSLPRYQGCYIERMPTKPVDVEPQVKRKVVSRPRRSTQKIRTVRNEVVEVPVHTGFINSTTEITSEDQAKTALDLWVFRAGQAYTEKDPFRLCEILNVMMPLILRMDDGAPGEYRFTPANYWTLAASYLSELQLMNPIKKKKAA